MGGTLICLAPRDEASRLPHLLDALLEATTADVFVYDRGSEDATLSLSEQMSRRSGGRLHAAAAARPIDPHRGRLEALRGGLERGDHAFLVEMRTDFSHPPRWVGALVDALGTCEVAVATRYGGGRRMPTFGLARHALPWLGNRLISAFLGPAVMDWSSGFVAYRRSTLEGALAGLPPLRGVACAAGLKQAALRSGRVAEVPLLPFERERGLTKLRRAEPLRALPDLLRLRRGGA